MRGRAGNYHSKAAGTRHARSAGGRIIRAENVVVIILTGSVDGKVGDGVGQGALPAPRDEVVCGIAERTCCDSNAHDVHAFVFFQMNMADGSGAGGGGDLRQAGRIGC